MVTPALAIFFLMLEWFTDTRALGFFGATYVLNAAAVLHFKQSGFNIEPPVSWVLVFRRASVFLLAAVVQIRSYSTSLRTPPYGATSAVVCPWREITWALVPH